MDKQRKFSDNKKIIIIVMCVFVFASVSLYSFNLWFYENVDLKPYKQFFSKEFDPTVDRIILVGTSHTARLDASYMEKQLSDPTSSIGETETKFEVFNLSSANFTPEDVLPHVDEIISMNPKLVIIGIGFFDFETPLHVFRTVPAPETMESKPLPDPNDLFYFIGEKIETAEFNQMVTVLNNPKLKVLTFIETSLEGKTIQGGQHTVKSSPGTLNEKYNMPFFIFKSMQFKIAVDEELKINKSENRFFGFDEEVLKKRVLALEKIISKFNDESIKVVIFTTPAHKHYLDTISSYDKERFLEIINDVSTQNNVPVYYFHEKYKNDLIFSDGSHVAIHERGLIFSDDMIKEVITQALAL